MLPRKIFQELTKQSKDRKISILLGARQVGKTTLLKALFEELSKNNKCLFLDIDILSNYEKVSTYELLLSTIKVSGYDENQKEYFYLFLDEFQKYPPLTKIMKNVYDNLRNIKIYASGSSSLTIKNEIQESLAGRKSITNVYPLDFEEFLWFKQNKKIIDNYQNIRKLKGDNLYNSLKEYNELLKEYMIFGGYPDVVLAQNKEDKMKVLDSIFDLYVKKDLVDYLKISKILEMKKLIEFLAVNNGQKIKYEEISKLTTFTFKEIKNNLEILKETFIIEILKPFYTNKNKEIVKIPKIYFLDNGVRNYFIKNFNEMNIREDSGFLFEGIVLSELIKNNMVEIKFWQDKNETEVDFILERNGLTAIEVKYKKELKSNDYNGLKRFKEEYPKTKQLILINLDYQKRTKNIDLILPYSIHQIVI